MYEVYFDDSLPARAVVRSEVYPLPLGGVGVETPAMVSGTIRMGYCRDAGEQFELLVKGRSDVVLGAWL